MKGRRKEAALVASGIIFGASIAAPAAGAALIAQQSSQKIVVDGKPMQIEAYSIGGNNYAKLRDDLFARNIYEVRRMVYTLYNALGAEPDAWRDGKPLFKINAEIPPEYEPYTSRFWPWREDVITDSVHDLPNVRYYVDVYDYYHNHVYMYTRYCFMKI